MFKEFLTFLKEFNVVALAIAFILGTAATGLINSLVKDILMPLIAPLLPAGGWQTATLALGPVKLTYGSFLAELINFIILALIVFVVARKVLKIETGAKK